MLERFAVSVSIFLLLISGCTLSPEAPLDELVNVGTHRLHIHCIGAGEPTIVIDTGIGETYESWESVIDPLGRETRVCSYDRAGYGQSEPGPMPRDSQRSADELHMLLVNSGEDGPFVLVGHSLGALNMQVYAHSYPEGVKGLVLLDPSPLAWIMGKGFPELRELFRQEAAAMRTAADAARTSSDPEEITNVDFLEILASEFEQFFGNTGHQVAAIRSFGELPLTVIGATEPEPSFGESAQAFRQFWNEESQILAGKSASGQFILAEGSSHHIHLDAPQVVIDAILEMIQ